MDLVQGGGVCDMVVCDGGFTRWWLYGGTMIVSIEVATQTKDEGRDATLRKELC